MLKDFFAQVGNSVLIDHKEMLTKSSMLFDV